MSSPNPFNFGQSGFGNDGFGEPPPPPPPPPIGSQPDIVTRLQRLMPNGWFTNGLSQVRDALLAGCATAFAFIFSMFAYIRQQTRIATATDGFLDLIATDYFGDELLREPGQLDPSYRARILSSIFLERDTRSAIIGVLTQLTGRVPIVFEPARIPDAGAYNSNLMAYGVGRYGSMNYPYQAFVIAFRPFNNGISNIGGYNTPLAGYNTPQAAYVSLENPGVQDSDIYAAIASVHVFGTIVWTQISS